MPTISKGLFRWVFCSGATIEDFADRLNHFWTFGILLFLAVMIGIRQGVKEPIHCWVPQEFSDSMTTWTDSHCWNSHFIQLPRDRRKVGDDLKKNFPVSDEMLDLPFVSFESPTPSEHLALSVTTSTIYQWIPLILFLQALLFKLPSVLLYLIHGYSGMNFDQLKGLTHGYKNLNLEERSILSRKISRYIYNWCNQVCFVLPWRVLTIIWLVTKVLFCINIAVQFNKVDNFIRTTDPPHDNSTSYLDVINDNLIENNSTLWKTSPVFPRQVMCEFKLYLLTRVQYYTVTCDLPMNEFIEVTYMFLWIWFLIVTIVTGVSLVTWLVRIFIPIFRLRYITSLIQLNEELSNVKSYEVSKFASWIGEDGVMALKIISNNSSVLVASDVVCNMWKRRQQEMGAISPQGTGYTLVPQTQGPAQGYQVQRGQEPIPGASAPPQPKSDNPPLYPGLQGESKM